MSNINLAKALATAQSEIKHAQKDATNPHFKSDYSTLAAIWDAARGPLTKNGLSVAQTQRFDGDMIISVTTLMHVSGETIMSELPLLLQRKDMQALGSAITYARRYQLASIVGISSDDDDGESSMGRHNSNSFGEYLIPFGKFEGRSLTDVPKDELKSYAQYIKDKAIADKKPLVPVVQEFINRVDQL
jgi:hypothetical protein